MFTAVLGSQCERDGPCSFVAGAECGQDATCACREGFIPRTSEDICEQGTLLKKPKTIILQFTDGRSGRTFVEFRGICCNIK